MSSRNDACARTWHTFHSTIVHGTRYRHQVKHDRDTKQWLVRTEVFEEGNTWPYPMKAIPVPERHGKEFFRIYKFEWSNLEEHNLPMYPAGYENGFVGLEE